MKIKEYHLVLGCVLIILIYLSPYLVYGQDCLIKTGDNLDSNIPWLKVMADNVRHYGWSYKMAPQVMDGIPKFCLGSQLNVLFLLYLLLAPFIAYVTNLFIMHIAAFAGMVLLLNRLSFGESENKNLIIYGTALCFALLDFWPSGGLSVAGQPLLLYALLRIKDGDFKLRHFLVIALFPFYSSLVLAGAFILFFAIAWALVDFLLTRRSRWPFYSAILMLAAFYLISEYQILVALFQKSGFVSHRLEFAVVGDSFAAVTVNSLRLFLFGLSSHANVFQFPLILLTIIVAAAMLIIARKEGQRQFLLTLAISAFISLAGGIYHWKGFDPLKKSFLLFKTFDFSRFSFLLPTTFYLLFFYSLWSISHRRKKIGVIVLALFLLQVGLAFKRNMSDRTLFFKVKALISKSRSESTEVTYRSFYAEALFKRIKSYIGDDPSRYRVVCLGFDPGVALFNGLYTLDAYVANYPLEYKHIFRRLIERELAKSDSLRRAFDDFGSTCYFYSAEIGPRSVLKNEYMVVKHLEINQKALKEMGCRYVLSAAKIAHPESTGLTFLSRFEDADSIWRIFVYGTLDVSHG